MIKRLLLAYCIFCVFNTAAAQNALIFNDAFNKQDTAAMHTALVAWERVNANDPELYTSYFNYYIVKGKSSVVRLDRNQGAGDNLEITDSTNQVVGYMYGETKYNPVYIRKGIDVIDRGIRKFPNRLDMRFGKIYILGEQKDFDAFTAEIVTTINYSAVNKNKWLWTKDEPVKDGKNYLLENIQSYVNQLFDIWRPASEKHSTCC